MTVPQKLWRMLTPEQRRSAVVLLGFMFIGMLLETLGVGLIIPALALMMESDLAAKYPMLAPWLTNLGSPSHEKLVVVGMLVLVGVFVFKALFLAFLAWRQGCFTYGLRRSLSQRLFTGYLRQPYTFHMQRNSAQLIRNVMGQVTTTTNVTYQGLTLITEILVLIGITALLITIEPLGALLVMGVFGLVGWGFNRFTRGHIKRWGRALEFHEGLRIQHLQQGMGGAKDVKLLGRESDFIAQYQFHSDGSASAAQYQTFLQATPRLLLETLAVIGLAALVIVMIGQGKPLEALLPTLGLFAAAAFRLMPSANRLISAIQSVRFSLPAINNLYSELCLLEKGREVRDEIRHSFCGKLVLDQIVFSYPSAEAPALRGVSLSISKGEAVGFIGSSGAGKSSLVDIILGLLSPDSGTVKVDGIDIQTCLRSWQDQIGYVPQSIFLTDDTLRRNVAFGLPNEQIDELSVWRAIRSARLEEFVNELPQGLDTLVGERGVRLSGGQRQRIGIARALYHDPPVLVFDEATSSLDTVTEQGIMDAVQILKGEKTVIIVAHRLSTVEQCDRIYRLDKGLIVEEGDASVVLEMDVGAVK